jgi:hypothetical protein
MDTILYLSRMLNYAGDAKLEASSVVQPAHSNKEKLYLYVCSAIQSIIRK